MRIIHVSDCFVPMLGGIETQVSQLAIKQSIAGHQVMVLTCAKGDKEDDLDLPFPVLRSTWSNPFDAPVDPRAPRRFLEAILRWSPDVIHLHMGELTPVVQSLLWNLQGLGYPTVVTVHSVWSDRLTIPIYRNLAKATGLFSSPIIWTGVSELVAGKLRKVVQVDNVAILPNGVEGDAWKVTPNSHSGLVAVTASRFAPRKRIPELLKILRDVSIANPGLPFTAVLAGDGPGKKRADEFVEKNGMENVISLPGRLSSNKLREQYSNADVFLSPSIKEAASIAGAEAQAAGLAILARAESGLGERISSDEGATVSSDLDFAATLQAWVRNPRQLDKIKEYNRNNLCPLDWSLVLPKAHAAYMSAASLVGKVLI